MREPREIVGSAQHRLLVSGVDIDPDQLGNATRERPGLIERDRADIRQRLDRRASAKQNAAPRAGGDRRKNSRRNTEHERARRHDHEQRHRPIKGARALARADKRRPAETEPADREEGRAERENDIRVAEFQSDR